MEQTTNFNLKKPAPEDFYNVQDFNDNMDILDIELKEAQDKAGNPPMVNGHKVESDVPANAKFTDTTYGNASTTVAGLMSPTDKTKLDGVAAGANNYTHPTTHPASMITGLPSSLPANGGNSDTVDGFHVDLGVNSSYGLRPIGIDTYDVSPGVTPLTTGCIYIMYE
ncbi:MAG: hypothetical protein K0R05_2436 [Anaerocolumna sp.]|jgi:hypothetical protein|nr:hypothetical protein [Anaerocolumna sp.]